jgi:hypothetical protein
MVNLLFRAFIILIALVATNEYLDDYQKLMTAYNKGQEAFGYLFIVLGDVFRSLGLSYFYVHLSYLVIMAVSIAALTRNLFFMVVLIVLVGEILNEQTRFFTGAFGAIALLIYAKKLKVLSATSVLVHPAAGVLAFAGYITNRLFIKFATPTLFLACGCSAFILSEIIRDIIIMIGSKLGYGYEGTVYLEPLSLVGKVFLFFILFLEFFKFKSEVKLNRAKDFYLVKSFFLLKILFSSFAIVSGRLLLIVTVLLVATSTMPTVFVKRKVSVNYNKLVLFSVCIVFAALLVRLYKLLAGDS